MQVGVLPDMIVFAHNGHYVLTADEAQPSDDYTVDPEGSVSVIRVRELDGGGYGDLSQIAPEDVRIVNFQAFNGTALDSSVRIFGPNSTVAQDLEPEYITVSHDSKTAWVTLQENNAIAELDIEAGTFTAIHGLGFKDHNVAGSGFDGSAIDGANNGGININQWPVLGMYQPDGIASYVVGTETFLVTANEGDARAYTGFNEEVRVRDLVLDPTAFLNPTPGQLQGSGMPLRDLRVTSASGKVDPACTSTCVYNRLYLFGARSFSIWKTDGTLVFDSGDQMEQQVAAQFPANFNANHTSNTKDNRSPRKGPEPEGVVLGKIRGRMYAFVGLERMSGVMIYDIIDPAAPEFVSYFNDRFPNTPAANGNTDLGPEGLKFISDGDSPTGEPLLLVGNEVSGTVAIYRIAASNK